MASPPPSRKRHTPTNCAHQGFVQLNAKNPNMRNGAPRICKWKLWRVPLKKDNPIFRKTASKYDIHKTKRKALPRLRVQELESAVDKYEYWVFQPWRAATQSGAVRSTKLSWIRNQRGCASPSHLFKADLLTFPIWRGLRLGSSARSIWEGHGGLSHLTKNKQNKLYLSVKEKITTTPCHLHLFA